MGIFPVPSIISDDVKSQYNVWHVGDVGDVLERFYAITLDRRVRHPAVVAICDSARTDLF
jgi:LysR family transcriptional activator of nhaA